MSTNNQPGIFEFSPALDVNALMELYCGDTLHSELVFSEFINETPGFLEEMDKLFEINDLQALKKLVHKFKPMLYYVGLTPSHKNIQQFEDKCAGSADTYSLTAEFNSIKNELNNGILLVKKELTRLQAYNGNTGH